MSYFFLLARTGALLLLPYLLAGQSTTVDTTGLAAESLAFERAYEAYDYVRLDSLAQTFLPHLAAAEGHTSLNYVNAVDTHAETFKNRGDVAAALALLQPLSADLLAKNGPDDPLYLRTQSHVGNCQCEGVNIRQGLDIVQRAVDASRSRAALPEIRFLRQLLFLARCQNSANQTGASLQTSQQLEALAREQGDDYYVRQALGNLTNTYMFLGRKPMHGYFFPKPSVEDSLQSGFEATEHPLIRSGLILAGANAAWSGEPVAEGKEDGILTAYEIAQLDPSDTELVVLSACETGLGDIQNGDGIYGLQRAFKLAGVRYVLVSLWSVEDQRTAEFMTEFYERYLTDKQAIPAAYQATQVAMRKRHNTPFNPRAWAGFVLLE